MILPDKYRIYVPFMVSLKDICEFSKFVIPSSLDELFCVDLHFRDTLLPVSNFDRYSDIKNEQTKIARIFQTYSAYDCKIGIKFYNGKVYRINVEFLLSYFYVDIRRHRHLISFYMENRNANSKKI